MRQIHPHKLWTGNVRDRDNLAAINDLRIAAIIDLADMELPSHTLSRDLIYCRWPLRDGPDNPDWVLSGALDFLERLVRADISVMVCCSAGMSRSVALAAMALARVYGRDPQSTLVSIAGDQPTDVSAGFWLALLRLAAAQRPVR